MDSMHFKRFIVLAVTTFIVVGLAVVGLIVLNDEMQKALVNTKENMYSNSEIQNTEQPSEEEMKVEW